MGMHAPDRPPMWPLSSDSCGQVVATRLPGDVAGNELQPEEPGQPRAVIPDEASHAQVGKRTLLSGCDRGVEGFFPQSQ